MMRVLKFLLLKCSEHSHAISLLEENHGHLFIDVKGLY